MADGLFGNQRAGATASDWNMLEFIVRSMINGMATATLVKVMDVTNDGGVSPTGFVDVQPLVNLLDGNGVAVPHGTIHRCPYNRLQGGANAVILDPEVGDVGIVVFADRDISSVMANRGQANPGSRRRFDMADAMYVGVWSATTPTQYVRFSDADGIEIVSPTKVKLLAPDIEIDCQAFELNASSSVAINSPNITLNGNVHNTGSFINDGGIVANSSVAVTGALTQGSKNVGAAHEHSGVQSGSSNTGGVV